MYFGKKYGVEDYLENGWNLVLVDCDSWINNWCSVSYGGKMVFL